MRLLLVANQVFDLVRRYERTLDDATLIDLRWALGSVVDLCRAFQPETADAFLDFTRLLDGWMKDRKIQDFGRFAGCFGRGAQYMSFVRR